MEKNIEKDKRVVQVNAMPDLLDSDLHNADVDTPDDMQFDEDGNFIFTDEDKQAIEGNDDESEDFEQDDESDTVDETLESKEQSYESDDDSEPKQKPSKQPQQKVSKEQLKIINMKKELQKSQAEKRELEERLSKIDNEQKKSDLVKKYVDEGIDEDVARKYADQELRNSQIEEKLEIIDFKESNIELFQKYPQARQDVKTIIRNSKLTGMTPEQICRAMYADSQSYEQRVRKEMVSGKQVEGSTNKSLESAARTSVKRNDTALSQSDRALKTRLERMFNGGKPLSDEEFKIVSKHF